jgi:hypothetical protein
VAWISTRKEFVLMTRVKFGDSHNDKHLDTLDICSHPPRAYPFS